MYYPCSENKDADQLRGYCKADLRLCFLPCKLLVFSHTGSYKSGVIWVYIAQKGYPHDESDFYSCCNPNAIIYNSCII